MNSNKPKTQIESAFAIPKCTLCGGRILIPCLPPELEAVIESGIETKEDRERFDWDGPESVLEEIGWRLTRIFAFYWQSLGPMTSECYIDTLDVGTDTTFVCLRQDWLPSWCAIAAIRGRPDKTVMTALFRSLVKENGAALGVELFGSLPSDTHNTVEDLISERTWKWRLRSESRGGLKVKHLK